ncbi:histidine kinase dimerization/phosphoacceptor domain -containing protein [Brumimicrobium mesophilum]|uniref:histidine kinase dimerization/phosphoacceptor domain -containing protein n=1 Tax=Brumimicrobium mesophilum TaxID=392717 RepID=UPI00131C698F|nr:histidine kinase dimerization/phosphoacceptor domain -containing protein [Brumimicrobium mesophilum]
MHNYLESIEELSNSTHLQRGEINDFTRKVLLIATKTLNCNNCGVWIFEENQTKIVSMIYYDRSEDTFLNQPTLNVSQFPNYFKILKKNKIVITNNTKNEPLISEIMNNYIIPNRITSMFDVPLRSEGKMIGLISVEHVEVEHVWTNDEKIFTQSLAQLLSLALETKKKREYQIALEKIIIQKEVLISEVNHRVKNNMAVIISLINLQKHKATDSHHSQLFEEINNKVYSMSMIQDQLNANENVDSIDLGSFLKRLIFSLNTSYGLDKSIEINLEMEEICVNISNAIPCGLIANEVLTNSFKYAFGDQNRFPKLESRLKQTDNMVELTFYDNGPGFDINSPKIGMGMELIKDLAEQIDAEINIKTDNGVTIQMKFPIS